MPKGPITWTEDDVMQRVAELEAERDFAIDHRNTARDKVEELEAENERLTAEVSRKDAAIVELWTIADTRDLDAEMALYVGGIVAEAMERDSGKYREGVMSDQTLVTYEFIEAKDKEIERLQAELIQVRGLSAFRKDENERLERQKAKAVDLLAESIQQNERLREGCKDARHDNDCTCMDRDHGFSIHDWPCSCGLRKVFVYSYGTDTAPPTTLEDSDE